MRVFIHFLIAFILFLRSIKFSYLCKVINNLFYLVNNLIFVVKTFGFAHRPNGGLFYCFSSHTICHICEVAFTKSRNT